MTTEGLLTLARSVTEVEPLVVGRYFTRISTCTTPASMTGCFGPDAERLARGRKPSTSRFLDRCVLAHSRAIHRILPCFHLCTYRPGTLLTY